MNCPTCGKAQLTERPHHHEANMDNPPEEPGFDDEPSADWVAGYQAGLDTARAPSASEDVGLPDPLRVALSVVYNETIGPEPDALERIQRTALDALASPTPETPSLDAGSRATYPEEGGTVLSTTFSQTRHGATPPGERGLRLRRPLRPAHANRDAGPRGVRPPRFGDGHGDVPGSERADDQEHARLNPSTDRDADDRRSAHRDRLAGRAGAASMSRRLSRGEHAALLGMLFLATLGLGLFAYAMDKPWIYITGIGWGVVLAGIWDWARGLDG